MRRHPALGADVVARFSAYGQLHRLVRHHHERWDGGGYPDRTGGDRVPLGARVLAVADAFDALTSVHPYRGAMDADRAARVLADGAGSQWDPRVVDALLAHLARPNAAAPVVSAHGHPVDRFDDMTERSPPLCLPVDPSLPRPSDRVRWCHRSGTGSLESPERAGRLRRGGPRSRRFPDPWPRAMTPSKRAECYNRWTSVPRARGSERA